MRTNRHHLHTTLSVLLVLLFGLPLGLHAQVDSTDGGDDTEEIERLEAWPPLGPDSRKQVREDVARLRAARTPEMADEAHAALRVAGAAAAPALLDALGKEKDEDTRERIEAVLDSITDATHTRLLAKRFDDAKVTVRTYAMKRTSHFPDRGTRKQAQAAWQDVQQRLKKKSKVDKHEHLAAAMAVTAGGDTDGLTHLHLRAQKVWKRAGRDIRAACEGARTKEATTVVLGLMSEDRVETIAALNLLAGCGTVEDAVPRIRGLLNSEDSGIQAATINALRGIVDGDPPIDKLSAFDATERANRWRRRV